MIPDSYSTHINPSSACGRALTASAALTTCFPLFPPFYSAYHSALYAPHYRSS